MQDTPRSPAAGIVLGAMTLALLCAGFVAVRPQSATLAKSTHFHARMFYVGHAPKTANG